MASPQKTISRPHRLIRMGTGWQLAEGVAALFISVFVSYWLFVAPSRARRQRREKARELRDPREH